MSHQRRLPEHDVLPTGAEIIALRWERIQLVVSLSGSDDLPTGQLYLVPEGDSRAPPIPATADEVAGQARLLRYNVMAGPGQMPLAPGTWKLAAHATAESGGDRWLTLAVAPELSANQGDLAQTFRFPGGAYRVEPSISPTTHALRLLITVKRTRSAARLRRRRSGWKRRLRVRLFDAFISTLQVLPRFRRFIVFTSDSRTDLGGNLKLVYDRMVERGLDRRYSLRAIFKPSVRARRRLRDKLRLVWLLARADIILLDDYQPAVYRLRPRPDVRIIQLWHAWGSFKTVGYSRVGKPGGPSPYSRVHKNYTYAVVGSPHDVPYYAEAFGIPPGRVIPTGIPKMDEFTDAKRQEVGRERALSAFPAARGRRVFLFAPTFRGGGARSASYPMHLIEFDALYRVCLEREAILIFKMHPFVRDRLSIPERYDDRLFDASRVSIETNDLLLITDLLITDYSSLIFEYSTLGRPMVFFAFDLDQYVASRDFYEPFEEFVPGPIARSFPELIELMRRDDLPVERVQRFAKRHLPASEGSATDRIIDQLILPA